MVKCPECGREVPEPYVSWIMKPHSKSRSRVPKVRVSWFSCMCGHRFRVVESLEKKQK